MGFLKQSPFCQGFWALLILGLSQRYLENPIPPDLGVADSLPNFGAGVSEIPCFTVFFGGPAP